MEIKDIRVKRIEREGSSLKAFCSINFEDQFVVHGIRLIEGDKGFFLSFPSITRKNNGFTDIAHPISTQFRQLLTEKIIEQYNKTPIEEAPIKTAEQNDQELESNVVNEQHQSENTPTGEPTQSFN